MGDVGGMIRIGLIADTHMPGSLKALWPQAIAAFEGVDCILHAGDLHTLEIVDELNRIAPVYVAKGNGDEDIHDARLQHVWNLEFGDVRIGMIHQFPSPERKSGDIITASRQRHFGLSAPHVVIFGHTHMESLHVIDDVLYVNPGSPTLPRNQSLRLGTIGILDIAPQSITATIHQLTDHGVESHRQIMPLQLAVPNVVRR